MRLSFTEIQGDTAFHEAAYRSDQHSDRKLSVYLSVIHDRHHKMFVDCSRTTAVPICLERGVKKKHSKQDVMTP